ncbi:MAG TPA: hypothetical protein VGH52_04780 [Gaiellaceae bacterium]|jgi:hypothetical protein
MRASIVLANFAKISDGMVDALGVGWTYTGPGPITFFATGIVTCDWHELNQEHTLRLELLDADGKAVPLPQNDEPILAEIKFEIGRPPGTKHGTSFNFPFAIPFGAFVLTPGEQYVVAMSIDGESNDAWRLPFTIRDAPPEQG